MSAPIPITPAKFSTKFGNPVKVKGYPLTLGIIIDAGAPAPLYFQRRFLDINRQLLETKSTLIPQSEYGKYLRLTIDDVMIKCAVHVEADITDTNINTTGICPGDVVTSCPVTNATATAQSDTQILLTWENTPCAPIVAPVTNATAAAQSDTEILLTWINP